MRIMLDKQECATYFYNALCNGLPLVYNYGIEIDNKQSEYDEANAKLKSFDCIWSGHGECYEDVLMVMLCTCGLRFKDFEGGMDDVTIHIDDLQERMSHVPPKWIMQMADETDDGVTADVIIQCVLYGEIVFG